MGFLLATTGLPQGAAAQGVSGFHGFDWGTPASGIPLISETDRVELPAEASLAYATYVRFLGMPTRAVFLFDPRDGGLTGGMYMAEPADASCVAQFRTIRLMTTSDARGDSVAISRGTGSGAPGVTGACREFRDAADPRPWTVVYRNRESGRVSARIRLFSEGGTPRILVCYGAVEECAWPPGLSVEGPAPLAPATRDTASGDQPE